MENNQDWLILEISFNKNKRLVDSILIDLSEETNSNLNEDESPNIYQNRYSYSTQIQELNNKDNQDAYVNVIKHWTTNHNNNSICI